MINKFKIFLKIIKNVENWYLVPIVYFGLYKKNMFYLKIRNGLKISLRNKSTDIQAFVNVWINEEYKQSKSIRDNEVVIDIGAHIGLFTLYISQMVRSKRIICFEPIKENFELLEKNITENNIQNCDYYNLAVYSESKELKIFLNDMDGAAHSVFGKGKDFINIQSITLKDIFDNNNISNCSLLKLDCEGAEYEIINSFPKEYFTRIGKIVLEYHFSDKYPNELEKLKNNLRNFGFKLSENIVDCGMGILLGTR